jgi:preprotein translocase subunit SecA
VQREFSVGLSSFIVNKIIGTQNERTLKKIMPVVETINGLEPQMTNLTDAQLRVKTDEFRQRIREKMPEDYAELSAKEQKEIEQDILNEILPEAFAVVREAGRRTIKMRHFDVQLVGGVVLHEGKIAEMATGEGKTLVATLSIYLNALTGRGVHLVTVNDYLARRDCGWMGPIYHFLGLSVSAIGHDLSVKYDPSHEDKTSTDERMWHLRQITRKEAYLCDVTYGTNNEFGFDYLRDNMVVRKEDMVQRELNYAIVDEVDSILIDEARTPLIISGPAEESTDKYYQIDKIIPRLQKDADYQVDEKSHTASLTEEGVGKAEKLLGVGNLYEDVNIELVHHVNQALRAHSLYRRDRDYMIKDNQVVIVDEFTGRLMPGRRWSDGLHQAVEAKEGVRIERENQTLATITFQNYFRIYRKLAGMTGTAATEAAEFHTIYKLDVVVIPTNKTLVRTNHPDVIYRTEKEKFNAVIEEICRLHESGRPVLVGTISIEKSEKLSQLLIKGGIPHHVLNARYHEKEAEIVAKAGQKGAVTIATNMAGRGTDIVLGEGVAQLAGLHITGTERHEARRIDNQLRGRAGRQGDPGSSRFYLSLEDDLMRIFGSDRISGIMARLGMEEGQSIEHGIVTRAIQTAQKRVEAHNFDIRKHLLEYDNVMNKQREVIYDMRRTILEGESLKDHILEILDETVDRAVNLYTGKEVHRGEWDIRSLVEWVRSKYAVVISETDLQDKKQEEMRELIYRMLVDAYDAREKSIGTEIMRHMERMVMLQLIDTKWKDHLYTMDSLREGIGLRAYGQRDPLIEYQHEAFDLFSLMVQSIKEELLEFVFKVRAVREEPRAPVSAHRAREFLHPEAAGMRGMGPREPALASSAAGNPRSRFERSEDSSPERQPGQGNVPYKRGAEKVGRNDPCPCGSGKKYKKCCGAQAI